MVDADATEVGIEEAVGTAFAFFLPLSCLEEEEGSLAGGREEEDRPERRGSEKNLSSETAFVEVIVEDEELDGWAMMAPAGEVELEVDENGEFIDDVEIC